MASAEVETRTERSIQIGRAIIPRAIIPRAAEIEAQADRWIRIGVRIERRQWRSIKTFGIRTV